MAWDENCRDSIARELAEKGLQPDTWEEVQ
jgi:hypothetical protein